MIVIHVPVDMVHVAITNYNADLQCIVPENKPHIQESSICYQERIKGKERTCYER